MTYTANCLCNGVRLRVEGELEPIQICHCLQCRKAQGSAFAANIPVDRAAVTFDSGTELLSEYESSPGKTRVFCRRCGSPVYSARTSLPGVVRIRAGLFNEPLPVRPVAESYVAHRANWWTAQCDVPQFPEAYSPAAPRS